MAVTIYIGVTYGPQWSAAYSGARTTYETGSLEAGLKAAAISYGTYKAMYLVGDVAPSGFGNIAGHALVGCVAASASGGPCGAGAIAGAAGAWADSLNMGSMEANLVTHAVIGGTASVLGGGKFANGAQTAAFGYLFNCLMHEACAKDMTRDSRGGYLEQRCVNGQCFTVRLHTLCATMECQQENVNVDWSASGSAAHAKALDVKLVQDVGTAATVVGMASPVGAIGAAASITGLGAAGAEFAMTGNMDTLVLPFVGARVANWLSRAGMGEAWARRIGDGVGWVLGESK